MKIGIITLYYKNYNYGGMLQAYALVQAINEIISDEDRVEQICFDPYKEKIMFLDRVVRFICRGDIKGKIKRIINRRNTVIDDFVSVGEIEKFAKKYVTHSTKVYCESDFLESQREYDVYICGSDQIWNPVALRNAYMLCSIKKKKIAYAPSIAIPKLKFIEKIKYKKHLKKLEAISVREKSASIFLGNLLKRKVEVVLDPVLLLAEENWKDLIGEDILISEKYMFVYVLGQENKKMVEAIEKYKTSGKKVYGIKGCTLECIDLKIDIAGPIEFLHYIKEAEFVITDSFHAMVFSVCFRTKFFVYERIGEKIDMSERIIDYLKMIDLQKLYDVDEIEYDNYEIDFSMIHRMLNEKRKKSISYLKQHILGENGI